MIERLLYDWRMDVEYKEGAGHILLQKTEEAVHFLERVPKFYVQEAIQSVRDWAKVILTLDFDKAKDRESVSAIRHAMLTREQIPEPLEECIKTVGADIFEEMMHLSMKIKTTDDESLWHNLNINTRAGYLRVIARYTSYLIDENNKEKD
jgi:hypothetical protein